MSTLNLTTLDAEQLEELTEHLGHSRLKKTRLAAEAGIRRRDEARVQAQITRRQRRLHLEQARQLRDLKVMVRAAKPGD